MIWKILKYFFLVVATFAVFYYVPPYYIKRLTQIANRDVLTILPAAATFIVILCFALFSLFIWYDKKYWVDLNFINLVLVLLTITVSVSVYFVDQLNTFYKTNTALQAANVLNLNYAEDFLKDQNSEWLYWTYFLTSPYEQNLSFIGKNFSLICSEYYLSLLATLNTSNELNRNTNEIFNPLNLKEPTSLAAFQNRKQEIFKNALATKNLITRISTECHLK